MSSARVIFGLFFITTAVIVFWLVDAAAYSKEEAEAIIANPPGVDWMSIEDDPSRKLEISWMPLPRFPNGAEGAFAERILEEKFDVDLKPILLDSAGYAQRKPMLFASGDIPDLVWNGNPSDVQRDIYHGCIRPIPLDLIRKYAPTYFELISEYAPLGWLYSDYNGKNWGLPNIWMGGALPTPGVWRKDWLDAVGFEEAPETLDEFHEAFRRFTFDDPDGNGIDDTYGLTNTTIGWHQMFSEFFGAYGVLPFDWMENEDGIVWGGITPEAKEVLAILRDWYDEGIIDPEWVTDGLGGQRRFKEKFLNGRVGYAFSMGNYNEFNKDVSGSLINVLEQVNPEAEILVAGYPVGPGGKRGVRNWGSAANIFVAGPGVVEEPLKLIRILKMLEYQVGSGHEVYLRSLYGEKGLHWDYAVPDRGEIGTGSSSGIVRLEPFDGDRRYQQDVLPIWGISNPGIDPLYMSIDELKHMEEYQPEEYCLLDAIGRPGLVPSAQQYLEDLRNWQLTVYTEIIRGERPLEYFDEFAEIWLDRGGAVMTSEAAEILRRKKQLYQEIGIDGGVDR